MRKAAAQIMLGLALIAAGFWTRGRMEAEQATLIETRGTVVEVLTRRERILQTKDFLKPDEYRVLHAPVVEIHWEGGQGRFNGSYDTGNQWSTGGDVLVRYHPKSPLETAYVVDPFDGLSWLGIVAMGGWAAAAAIQDWIRRLPARPPSCQTRSAGAVASPRN
ncbi:MAG: hypothetical protein U0Q16_02525 [Bryobacteraceae bacterium]